MFKMLCNRRLVDNAPANSFMSKIEHINMFGFLAKQFGPTKFKLDDTSETVAKATEFLKTAFFKDPKTQLRVSLVKVFKEFMNLQNDQGQYMAQ